MAKVGDAMPDDQESMGGCAVCCPPDPDVLGLSKYDYKWLCLPSLPCTGKAKPPLFLAKDEKLPFVLAMVMGLQHALAMVAGIATSGGKLIAGDACFAWQKDEDMCDAQAYLISAAWITSGLLTVVQVLRAKLCGGYYLGTGLISVMGTSFTFLPVAREMVVGAIKEAKANGEDPTGAGMEGYGKFLGTCMVASFFEMGMAMMPASLRKKFFPPVVTGTAVFLIGASLIGSGVKYLGGGVFCGENDLSRSAAFGGPQLCEGNGDVVLPYGAPQYVFLGLSVIVLTIVLQIVGSPFLKSTALFWGLVFGMVVAGIATYEAVEGDKAWELVDEVYKVVNAEPGKSYGFWNSNLIDKAPTFTFLWATTFPLGFSPEYFLPILIAYFVSTAETVGDIAASCDASEVPSTGEVAESRVQGGLLADGLNSLLACLFTSPPNTTFSQNNGVLKLTRCASRSAGFACSFWLILFGVFGKFGATIAACPDCVVGGLTLMCFSMVMVGGIEILCQDGNMTRRNRFIVMLALGFGLGVALMPNLFEGGGVTTFYGNNLRHNTGFWPKKDVCVVFPSSSVVTTPAFTTCTVNGFAIADFAGSETDCTGTLGGAYEHGDEVSESAAVETCVGNNGLCCLEYENFFWRTSLLMMLKTPYCIGVLVALTLHLVMPEDGDDEGKLAEKKASPGEDEAAMQI